MTNTNDKQRLIEYLSLIRDCEVEKPVEEINPRLVDACVKLLLKLNGKEVAFTTEQIKEKVSNIPFVLSADFDGEQTTKAKKYKTKRILLVAAIITILCIILAVCSIGQNIDYWHSVMNEKFGSVYNVPVGEKFVEGSDIFVYEGKSRKYINVDDFFKNEAYDVLIPTSVPDEIGLKDVLITDSNDTIIVDFKNIITSYEINLDTPLPQAIKDNLKPTTTANNLLCYTDKLDEVGSVQIYFEHNGNYYSIGGTDKQILLDVIEKLEEYK